MTSTRVLSFLFSLLVVAVCRGQLPDIVLDCESAAAGTTTVPGGSITVNGAWTLNTAVDMRGAGTIHDGNVTKTSKWVLYTPTLPSAGLYQVSAWYQANAAYASNLGVVITAPGGAITRTLNQRVNGGQWNVLGTFQFNAGTSGTVKLVAAGTNGYVIGDAIRFRKIDPSLVIDSHTSGILAGTWTSVTTGAPAANAGNFHHDGNANKGACTIGYPLNLTEGETFAVYAQWIGDPTNSAAVPIRIYHQGGYTDVTPVNQKVHQREGYYLGTYFFPSGNLTRVEIRNVGTTGRVVADAITFVKVASSSLEMNVDATMISGVTNTGCVAAVTTDAGANGSTFFHDQNTGKGSRYVTYSPTLSRQGQYVVYAWWRANPADATNTPVDVWSLNNLGVLALTTVTANQQQNGARWVRLGRFKFPTTGGYVKIRNGGTTGYVIADSLRFVQDFDNDGDLMPDAWELSKFLDPESPADAAFDPDQDGLTNLQEYNGNTDPADFFNGQPPFLQLISGNDQFSAPNLFIPQPLVIEVHQSSQPGAPLLGNVPVTFTITSGGGLLAIDANSTTQSSPLTVWTNASTGRVQVVYKQPNFHGVDSAIQAKTGANAGLSNTITFNLHTHRLSAFWKCDETSGTSIVDSSPSSPTNTGTIVGGVTRVQSFDYVSPGPDNALQLNGTSGCVSVNHSSTLSFSDALFSVTAWVTLDATANLASTADIYPIVSKWIATGTGFEFALKGGSANGLSFRTMNAGATAQEAVASTNQATKLKDGYPHHVAYTRGADNVGRLYIDGTEVGVTSAMTGSLSNSSTLYIGRNNSATPRYFKGTLEDVKLLASTLRSDEIASAANADADGLPDGLEWVNFGNLTIASSWTGDNDIGGGDGLTNLQEYQLGTKPGVRDSDGDGMNDGEEVTLGYNPVLPPVETPSQFTLVVLFTPLR